MYKLTLTLILAAMPAAQASTLATCRAMPDATQRLQCYDALPLPAASQTPVAATQPAAAPAPVAAATAAPAAAPTRAQQIADFGLENQKKRETLDGYESTITGAFEGWEPNDIIRLDNGQHWRVADGSSAFVSLKNPKVRIRRGMLGAVFLEFDGTNKSPKVVRVK